MGQTQNKKEVQQPKPTNCRELVQFIYNYNINFFDEEYLQVLQKLPLKYSGLISQFLIQKLDQSELWQKLFKKQIKNLDDQELCQIMSLSIPDTYLRLSESKLDNFCSLFSTYLSNSDLPLESETLNKLSLALYSNYIHETNQYLDQLTNKEEMQFLISERKCIFPNKKNIQNCNSSKLIKIILLIREMLETDCKLIEYILSSVEEIEFQIYFYQIFWELFTKTLVCLKVYSRFYSDFQQLIDIKYEIDKVQPMKAEVVGACIWGQIFTGWIQKISSEIDGKIKQYRNNGYLMPYYAQLLSSLLDIMGNENTMTWIGHSRVPHTDNIKQFKNLLINNTLDRQNDFPQGDFDKLKVDVENDIQLMRKVLPSWLVNHCVVATHINYLKEYLQENLANLPDYEITIIINKLQGDFQKVEYEEKDHQKPLPDYMKIRQSHFDLHEIIEELGYTKLDSITKSEYSTVKTTCSQMQQNRIFSILSSLNSSSQQQSINLQQINLNSEITQHQSHLTQATNQRKYSNESFTEETEIPIYDLVSYYISLVIQNQVNIADMDFQIQFKNKGQVIPSQIYENQFCTVFKKPIESKKTEDSFYKMAPCGGTKFLSETLLENM